MTKDQRELTDQILSQICPKMDNLKKINNRKSFINFFEGTTKFWQFELLDMIKGYLHSKFYDIPYSGFWDIKKNVPK